MKRNVDLTADRDFGGGMRIPNLSLLINPRKYPWSKKSYLDDLCSDFEIIRTGNKAERDKKRDSFNIGKDDICECCGIDCSSRPWSMKWGLCIKCKLEMDNQYDIGKSFRSQFREFRS